MRLIAKVISLCFMLFSSSAFSAEGIFEWSLSQRHSFCQNFPAGHEADGKKLYVSQIVRTEQIFGVSITMDENGNISGASPEFHDEGSSWHIGKAGTHLKQGMTYGYGGKEYDVGDFKFPSGNHYPHYTLCLTTL